MGGTGAMHVALAGVARLRALAETGLMGGASKPTLDRFVRLGRTALEIPVTAVSLVDDSCQFFASAAGLPDPDARTLPLSHSFCSHVVVSHEPLIFSDALEHPTLHDNPAIADLGVRAYAGFPITTDDGHVLGSFCAIDVQPHPWTERELAILEDLSLAVSAEMDLIRRAHRAERSERQLAQANVSLVRASEPARRTRGVLHDLATPLNTLVLGLEHLEEHEGVRELDEVLETVEILCRSARHASAVLAEGRAPQSFPVNLDVGALLREVCVDLRRTGSPIECVTPPDGLLVQADRTAMRRCFENLLSNASRFARSRIVADATGQGELVTVSVEDDGQGLPDADDYQRVWDERSRFHSELSRQGLGLSVVRELVESLGGQVAALPSELGGARFVLRLPRS